MRRIIYKLLFRAVLVLSVQQAWAKPLVIAHRGASGYLPEHTLEAAILAFAQGADFIEQDLVLSKDGVPVVLHDIHLESVTDVEQVFPDRHRPDGRFYALDFTLAELQQLHKHERTDSDNNQVFPSRYQGLSPFRIATFEQHIELIQQLNRQFNKQVGLYPEIKSPAWHRQQGVDISKIVLKVLRKHQLDSADSMVFIQCFDFAETKRIRNELGAKVKLIQLLADNSWHESSSDYDYLQSSPGLAEIAKVAQGIGPWVPQLFDLDKMQPTPLAANAKQNALLIHPYTFRVDELPPAMGADELLTILFDKVEVDGIFTDFTDVAVNYLYQKRLHEKDLHQQAQ
ncbi:glycerophosphodiester phosphodiesterase [Aliiglaciecola sp. LCG003]|uniref:glycerophosphodiester phosphodiesterase n=1 Tax=Aliiglaciecola sp. LCG003 TaxID=3053655 RepID=UPI002572FBD4|nr:glycerophosphodiester phosphodiesterase [Aliiglaciecola sp. LCG003]WJG08281.1 glycerophosphodiester phosphodiesterase [Aliiglaciecola sp. LCG003]